MSILDESAGSGDTLARIHDKLFKDVFKGPEYVTSLIEAGAPADLFEILDWTTLSLERSSILAEQQSERTADLVFSVAIKDSEKDARIVLLFEHKSHRDASLELQMARNQFLMYLEHDFEFLVIPIVVLQDATVERRYVMFSNLFPALSEQHLKILTEYSINFTCLLINMSEIDRQGLAEHTNIDAVVRAMAKVRGSDSSLLQQVMDRIDHIQLRDRERIWNLLMRYVCVYNRNITPEDILSVKTKTPEAQQMVRSAVQIIRDEGRAEGLEKGLEQGLEKGRAKVASNLLLKGMEPKEVIEVTELSLEQIESLRHEINNSSER